MKPCASSETLPLRTVTPWKALLLTTTLPSMKIMLPSSLPVSKVYEPATCASNSPDQTPMNWLGLLEYRRREALAVEP